MKRVIEQQTRSLQACEYFIEESHKFVDPLKEYEIIKVEYNAEERELKEKLEILKERKKERDRLINGTI